MKRSLYLAVLTVAIYMLSGCRPAPSLVGTWESGMGGALSRYHFYPSGKFVLEDLFEATRAQIEGNYKVEGGKLFLTPSHVDVQGEGPAADQIRSVANQPSRVTITSQSDANFQLGKDNPPLMVHKISPDPDQPKF